MKRFNEWVAVITGGGAGIGLATARRIAAEGGRVALLDWSADDLERAEDVLASQSRLLEQRVEDLPGRPHERAPGGVLPGSRRLADDDDPRERAALPRHERGARLAGLAAASGVRADLLRDRL